MIEFISYIGKICKLRPLKKEDMYITLEWRNQPEIREKVMGFRFPVTEAMEEKWFNDAMNDQSKTRTIFAIEDINEKRIVGIIYLFNIDWISRIAYFGMIIGKKEDQRSGFGTEAGQILFNYAFKCLNLRKIMSEVADFNSSSKKYAESMGMKHEASLKQQLYLNNNYFDICIYSIFQDEYHKKINK